MSTPQWDNETRNVWLHNQLGEMSVGDVDALTDEIETIIDNDDSGMASELHQLLIDLLHSQYVPEKPMLAQQRKTMIIMSRYNVRAIQAQNPDQLTYCENILESLYRLAATSILMGEDFPTQSPSTPMWPLTCPWTLEQILDYDYYPVRRDNEPTP